jgi:plastocyanin
MKTFLILPSFKTILIMLIISSLIGTACAKIYDPISKMNHQSKYHIQIVNFNTKDKTIPTENLKPGKGQIAKPSHNAGLNGGQRTKSGHNAGLNGGHEPVFDPFNQNIIIPTEVFFNNNFHFDQQQLNIPVGATVNWKNHDSINHFIQVSSIIQGSFNHQPFGSKDLTPFDTLTLTFNQPGKYIFQCLSPNHNSMTGTIIVS